MAFERAVPVLQAADVAKSMAWYTSVLGFNADPFPEQPPYSFAILRRDTTELMLQLDCDADARPSPPAGWAVYLRVGGGQLLALAELVRRQTALLRGPERMFYDQVEFEVADPDQHRICVAEILAADADVPAHRE